MDAVKTGILTLQHTACVSRTYLEVTKDPRYLAHIHRTATAQMGIEAFLGGVIQHREYRDSTNHDLMCHEYIADFLKPGYVAVSKARLRFLEETAANYRRLCK
jgi:hypothetical protein